MKPRIRSLDALAMHSVMVAFRAPLMRRPFDGTSTVGATTNAGAAARADDPFKKNRRDRVPH